MSAQQHLKWSRLFFQSVQFVIFSTVTSGGLKVTETVAYGKEQAPSGKKECLSMHGSYTAQTNDTVRVEGK